VTDALGSLTDLLRSILGYDVSSSKLLAAAGAADSAAAAAATAAAAAARRFPQSRQVASSGLARTKYEKMQVKSRSLEVPMKKSQ